MLNEEIIEFTSLKGIGLVQLYPLLMDLWPLLRRQTLVSLPAEPGLVQSFAGELYNLLPNKLFSNLLKQIH